MENIVPSPTFTPIDRKKISGGNSLANYFLSFFIALCIVLIVYFSFQISKPVVFKSKASEHSITDTLCIKDNIASPNNVSAKVKINNIEVDVKSGDTIKASEITFMWKSVADAVSYYVLLSKETDSNKGLVDPAIKGKEIKDTVYTVTELEPNTNYYFLVRTKSKKNNLSLVFPTPGNCDFVVAALPAFQFTNQAQ